MTSTIDAIKPQPGPISVGRLPGSVALEVGQPPTETPGIHDLYLAAAEGAFRPIDGTKALVCVDGPTDQLLSTAGAAKP